MELTNAHCRRDGEVQHERVLVERVRWQEPHVAGGPLNYHTDERQDHIPYADDRHHNSWGHLCLARTWP